VQVQGPDTSDLENLPAKDASVKLDDHVRLQPAYGLHRIRPVERLELNRLLRLWFNWRLGQRP
jgi:hypothetical protein